MNKKNLNNKNYPVNYPIIFSALLSGCAARQKHFVDYPVVVDDTKAVYAEDEDNNCYLKLPLLEEKILYVYDQGCKRRADSITITLPDNHFLLHQRQELNLESQNYLDSLLQKAVEYLDNQNGNKNKNSGYNELPF